MCNLYSMTATIDEMRKIFGSFEGETANLPPFDEIYPGRSAPVLVNKEGGGLRLETMTWGFPGPAATGGRPVTNVRNLASPFWRSALDNPARRCLVPVTRFCEWTQAADPVTKRKSKCWFGLHEDAHPLFAFAGIWRPGGEASESPFFAFLTCDSNSIVGAVHPKAMPVMLRPGADCDRWLGAARVDACALAVPFADTDMRLVS